MKILVIGSGPIVIGQAAEFDYAGTQACKALREEGHEVVLINSNPATIMTDEETADRVYIEPLTPYFCERVIAAERPEGLLATLGGQTGLNLASALAQQGILEKYGVRLLGTPLEAIQKAEDREQFRALMREINEPVPESWIVESPEQLEAILDVVPYPCIVRPAYTLGGTGGGIAKTRDDLWEIGNTGLKLSMRSQIMVERSLLGWKEVEYEVMRDSKGTCITICNMENFDPMGVHTGDSIVVAPSQTLSDIEYHMLRTASLKIIRSLGIEGGCNVQLAMSPESFDYYVIEVNPRVSRSSALASKATGYPIARVAAKIAIGKTLDEIENQVTGTTKACFEPALDYCVVKIPRWPFDKFQTGDRTLFTQMKATGEVMAIDRSFEAAFLKAIRGLEVKQKDLWHEKFAGPRQVMGLRTLPTSELEESADPTWRGRPAHGPAVVPPASSPEKVRELTFGQGEVIRRQGRLLPHWRQSGGIYFVTFRLADSLPSHVLEALRAEKELIEEHRHEAVTGSWETMKRLQEKQARLDRFLDAGHGSCVLKNPAAAQLVANAIQHFEGVRYHAFEWVVMPNHVHALVQPMPGFELEDILKSWKSFTAHELAKQGHAEGKVWQDEYYDHIVRDESEFAKIAEYIVQNPAASGLNDWQWVSGRTRGRDDRATEGGTPSQREGASPKSATDLTRGGLSDSTERGRDARETVGGTPTPPQTPTTKMPDSELRDAIRVPTDERLWAIAEGLRRGWSVQDVQQLCKVDPWFLNKMRDMIAVEQALLSLDELDRDANLWGGVLERAFELGFDYAAVAGLLGITGELVADMRKLRESTAALAGGITLEGGLSDIEATLDQLGAALDQNPEAKAVADAFWAKYDSTDPAFLVRFFAVGRLQALSGASVFKMVDTCAGEFESQTPYYYSALGDESDTVRAKA